MNYRNQSVVLAALLALLLQHACPVRGDIIFATSLSNNTVGEYDASSRQTVNGSLISGLQKPYGLAVDGNGDVFVANAHNSTIGEYTNAGATINASLISRIDPPVALALDGNGHLFVLSQGPNSIGTLAEYTTSGNLLNRTSFAGIPWGMALDMNGHVFVTVANPSKGVVEEFDTSGGTLNASLISGLVDPYGIACDANGHLFVVSYPDMTNGIVGEYTTMGATVKSALITGLASPRYIALGGSGNIFLTNDSAGTIGEYTSTGATINASLFSGLPFPFAIAVQSTGVPLPNGAASGAFTLLICLSLAALRSRVVA
jgi:DNA-binding beta-propeller fold protein YncE